MATPSVNQVVGQRFSFTGRLKTPIIRIPLLQCNPHSNKAQFARKIIHQYQKGTLSTASNQVEARPKTRIGKRIVLKSRKRNTDPKFTVQPDSCRFCNKVFICSEEHEPGCGKNQGARIKQRQTDIRCPVVKNDFMQTLGLRPATNRNPTTPSATLRASSSTIDSSPEHNPKPRPPPDANTPKLTNFFRCNPVELSSTLGVAMTDALVQRTGYVDKSYDTRALAYRGNTGHLKSFSRSRAVRKNAKSELHTMSFGRNQRIMRATELELGLSRKSWNKFNKCREFQIVVLKLPEGEANEARRREMQRRLDFYKIKQLVIRSVDIKSIPGLLDRFERSTPNVEPAKP